MTTAQPASAPPNHPVRPRPRWRWLWIVALLAVGLAAHGPLLRMLARAMTVDDPLPAAAWVLVLGSGDYRFDRAADLYKAGGASGVLFVDPPPTRLVRCGVLPPKSEEFLREFARRGIPREAAVALPGNDKTPWQIAQVLEGWLAAHPDARVLVLCERFTGRDLSFVVLKVMPPGDARRVAFRDLPNHRFDESNWWRNRAGVRALGGAACDLLYDILRGEDAPTASHFDPDEYERELRAAIHGNDHAVGNGLRAVPWAANRRHCLFNGRHGARSYQKSNPSILIKCSASSVQRFTARFGASVGRLRC